MMISPISSAPGGATDVSWQSSSTCGLSSEERMLALVIYTQASRRDAAEAEINLSFEEITRLREEVKRAVEQAREAEKDKGFWCDLADFFGGDVAALAGAIAAVAAVVATGGAAAAVLAVVASAAAFAADHAEELGIPPELAMGIAIAASVAGLACGNGQGLLELGDSAVKTANQVKMYAQAAGAVASGVGAGAGCVAGQYEADALDHRTDATQAEGRQEIMASEIDEALALLRSLLQQQLVAARLTGDIAQGTNAGNFAILNNFAGAA